MDRPLGNVTQLTQLRAHNGEHPQTISTSYDSDKWTFLVSFARSVCDLLARLGTRSVTVLFVSSDDSVGVGDYNDGFGNAVSRPKSPASCSTYGVFFSLLASSTQAQEQVTHHTASLSQVPASPASAARQATTLRLQRKTSLLAAC